MCVCVCVYTFKTNIWHLHLKNAAAEKLSNCVCLTVMHQTKPPLHVHHASINNTHIAPSLHSKWLQSNLKNWKSLRYLHNPSHTGCPLGMAIFEPASCQHLERKRERQVGLALGARPILTDLSNFHWQSCQASCCLPCSDGCQLRRQAREGMCAKSPALHSYHSLPLQS